MSQMHLFEQSEHLTPDTFGDGHDYEDLNYYGWQQLYPEIETTPVGVASNSLRLNKPIIPQSEYMLAAGADAPLKETTPTEIGAESSKTANREPIIPKLGELVLCDNVEDGWHFVTDLNANVVDLKPREAA